MTMRNEQVEVLLAATQDVVTEQEQRVKEASGAVA